jgi:hypothetical protein
MTGCNLLDGEMPTARQNGKRLPCERLYAEKEELLAENAKLRELVSELWVSCPVHDSDCDECKHKGGRTGCELYDRMLELGVTA